MGSEPAGANLRGANLGLANLRGANLWGANLWGANLRGANLWEANLDGHLLKGYWQLHARSPHQWEYQAFRCECGWFIVAGCRRMPLSEMRQHYNDDERHDGKVKKWVGWMLDSLEGMPS